MVDLRKFYLKLKKKVFLEASQQVMAFQILLSAATIQASKPATTFPF